ncbi:MAG TPA: heme exporter protein CcmB [Rubricoccaceae bacterium]|nr:heme exporter protein CcmB [Rubricoccaceae bacterium]
MDFLAGAWALFLKDARVELRTRYALGALGLFVAASLVLLRLALGRAEVAPETAAALLWVVILFAAALGLGRAFVAEEERGTVLLLQLALPPSAVYAGKLAFNVALTLVVNLVAAGGFFVLIGTSVALPGLLLATLALGAVGLAGTTTLLSALLARTAGGSPLLAVLAFPVLVPLLFSAVRLTLLALTPGTTWADGTQDLLSLVGFAGLTITASALLFEYVWRD